MWISSQSSLRVQMTGFDEIVTLLLPKIMTDSQLHTMRLQDFQQQHDPLAVPVRMLRGDSVLYKLFAGKIKPTPSIWYLN